MNTTVSENIQFISENTVKQRMTREITNLIEGKGYNANDIDFYINYNNNHTVTYVLTLYDKDTNILYTFNISKNYPFNPPKVFINNKPYLHYLKITSDIFRNELEKYTNTRCFCCSSLLCNTNWSPIKSIINIVDEFKNYRNICKKIYFNLIVNIIKKKYLIDNINILVWLY